MGILARLSILSLSVLVVCGNPPGLVVPEKSPSVSRQARSAGCQNWCANPTDPGSYLCCKDIPNGIPRGCSPISGTRLGPWINNQGNCYFFSALEDGQISGPPRANWNTAMRACRGLGNSYSLAELGNPANLKSDAWLMEQITAQGQEVWLGAMDTGNDNQWYWASHRSLSISDPYWGPGEPSNCNRQAPKNCLSTMKLGDFSPPRQYFSNAACTTVQHYVCQLFGIVK